MKQIPTPEQVETQRYVAAIARADFLRQKVISHLMMTGGEPNWGALDISEYDGPASKIIRKELEAKGWKVSQATDQREGGVYWTITKK